MNQDVQDSRRHRALGTPKTARSRAAVAWVIARLAVEAGAALAGASHDNGTLWRAVLLAGHTRAAQPFRMDTGTPAARAAVRCYRKPAWGH